MLFSFFGGGSIAIRTDCACEYYVIGYILSSGFRGYLV